VSLKEVGRKGKKKLTKRNGDEYEAKAGAKTNDSVHDLVEEHEEVIKKEARLSDLWKELKKKDRKSLGQSPDSIQLKFRMVIVHLEKRNQTGGAGNVAVFKILRRRPALNKTTSGKAFRESEEEP